MRIINFSSKFNNTLKKISRSKPEKIPGIIQKLLLFNTNINHPSLKLHKLSGNLSSHWAISIEADLRIIFRYTEDGNILLVEIGSHDEVY